MLTRRSALRTAGALFAGTAPPGRAAQPARAEPPAGPRQRLCMAEDAAFLRDPPAIIARRFDLYRAFGFGTLRAAIAWRRVEKSPGDWTGAAYLEPYFAQAIAAGFRLKLGVETLGAPPGWFLRAHDDAAIRNAQGEISQNDLSLWYSGLHDVLSAKTARLFARLAEMRVLPAVDWIFADLGPASEPIYPAAWTQGKSACAEATPWFYGAYARADFVRAMQAKYRAPAALNAAWGTSFSDWSGIALPVPGAQTGAIWADALTWYRDSKRDLIRWQVRNYQAAIERYAQPGARPGLIIMVPGRHVRPEEWQAAVAAGVPSCSLAIMTDTEFLLDLARETGCALQYTADENGDEVAYLRQYMQARGNTQKLWGENVGTAPVAARPDHIVDVVLANRLYGMDYIRSSRIFEDDGVTPNAVAGAVARACRRVLSAWGGA
jgi:hypothetical protein